MNTLIRIPLLAAVFMLAAGFVTPLSAQNAPTLSAEDYAQIMMLYAKYPQALDSGNGEAYADLFTADGSFGNRVGRQALIEFASGRSYETSTVRHVPMTPIITPTAEGASGTVINFFVDMGTNPPSITRASMYTDTLVKTPQGWRFKTRVNGAIPGVAAPARGGGGGRGGAPATTGN